MTAAIIAAALAVLVGVGAFMRSAKRRRAAFQAAWEKQQVTEGVARALTDALTEQDAFEECHPVPYDWHQRQAAVRGRMERLLHARAVSATPRSILEAVTAAIPHPPIEDRKHVLELVKK